MIRMLKFIQTCNPFHAGEPRSHIHFGPLIGIKPDGERRMSSDA
jgi:hypothetical protein